ncbi:hypothetical protein ALC57_04320 [Trachymyrmex cornetzi]|uniref:Uncharacterized protein n=1 Tax=Trachymyrmex cornetzi TaxID=471704 RepID=A0A195EEB3_9HYME|nr:hypothetical protein ALC57_04320 [Trachymyrmex cornetzi]
MRDLSSQSFRAWLNSRNICCRWPPLSIWVPVEYSTRANLLSSRYDGKRGCRVIKLRLGLPGPPVQLEPVDLSVKTPVVLQVPRYNPAAIINAVARRVPSPSTTPTPPPPPLCVSTGE